MTTTELVGFLFAGPWICLFLILFIDRGPR